MQESQYYNTKQFRISGEDITQQIRGDSKNTGDAFRFFRIIKSQPQKKEEKINKKNKIRLQHLAAKFIFVRIKKLITDIALVFARVGKIGCIHTTSKSV